MDVISVHYVTICIIFVRFLDILITSLIPSHILDKFDLFSRKKLLKWFALLFWVSVSSTFLYFHFSFKFSFLDGSSERHILL